MGFGATRSRYGRIDHRMKNAASMYDWTPQERTTAGWATAIVHAPSCAVADVQSDHATIWSNTQNVENLVTDLTNVLSPLTAKQIEWFRAGGALNLMGSRA